MLELGDEETEDEGLEETLLETEDEGDEDIEDDGLELGELLTLELGEDETDVEGLELGLEEAELDGEGETLELGDDDGEDETEVLGLDEDDEDASTSMLAARYPPTTASLYLAVQVHTVSASAPHAPAMVILILDPTASNNAPVHDNCFSAVRLALAPVVEEINSCVVSSSVCMLIEVILASSATLTFGN